MDWIKFGLYGCLILFILFIFLFAVGFYWLFFSGYVIHNGSGEDVFVTYIYDENNTLTREPSYADIPIKNGEFTELNTMLAADDSFFPKALLVEDHTYKKRCIFTLSSIHTYDLFDRYYSIPPLNDKRCKRKQ